MGKHKSYNELQRAHTALQKKC